MFKPQTYRIFLVNSKQIGEQSGASLKAYCGLFEGKTIAGLGKWGDTVTPYAYAISEFLSSIEAEVEEPNQPFCIMPKNKAVETYVKKYAPLWELRGLNGHGEVPHGRDEWVRIAKDHVAKRFILLPDYKVFLKERREIDARLAKIQRIAGEFDLKEGEFVRFTDETLLGASIG
jgi:hypothetical protein